MLSWTCVHSESGQWQRWLLLVEHRNTKLPAMQLCLDLVCQHGHSFLHPQCIIWKLFSHLLDEKFDVPKIQQFVTGYTARITESASVPLIEGKLKPVLFN